MNTEFNFITEKQFKEKLERIMDSKGLGYILNELVNICNEKAEHLSENWQDENMAKQWNKTADKLDAYRLRLENICPLF